MLKKVCTLCGTKWTYDFPTCVFCGGAAADLPETPTGQELFSRQAPGPPSRTTRAGRTRVTRIEARRELAVSGEPAAWSDLIKANSSALTFLGITLGVFISRKFFVVPIGIGAMLAQDFLRRAIDGNSGRTVRR